MGKKKSLGRLGHVGFFLTLLFIVPVLMMAMPVLAANKIILSTETGLPEAHEQTWSGTGKPWTQAVAKRSGGTVEFKLHFGGELVSMIDLMRGVGSGMVNIGSPFTGYYPSEFAMEALLGTLTYPTFRPPDPPRMAITKILYANIPAFSAAYKRANVRKLFTISCPGWGIVSRVPVTKLSDLKGLKIRTFGTYIPKMLRAAGATPVTLPFSEVIDALHKRVVDGTFINLSNARDLKLQDIAKHIVMCGTDGIPGHVIPYAYVINLGTWKKLPAKIKRIMLEEGKRVEMEYAHFSAKEQLIAAKQMEKSGATLHKLSAKDLSEWAKRCGDFPSAAGKDLDKKKLPGTETIALIKKLAKLPMADLMKRYDTAWQKEISMIK